MINPNIEELKIDIEIVEPMEVTISGDQEIHADISGDASMEVIPSPGISGANNYEKLKNKPRINEVELIGNKTSKQLGLQDEMNSLTNLELDDLIQF